MKRAAVLNDGAIQVETALGALAAGGFEAVTVDGPAALRSQTEAGAAALVLGWAGDGSDAERAAAVAALPPALRRGVVVALVGAGLASGDGVRAFLLGADLVVAAGDLPRVGELVGAALAAKRTLVAPLDPAAAARLGG